MSHSRLPVDRSSDLSTVPVKPQAPYCNDVSWPLAFIHTSGLASYQYKLEYCDLTGRQIIREVVYTINDKVLKLRYTLTKYIE